MVCGTWTGWSIHLTRETIERCLIGVRIDGVEEDAGEEGGARWCLGEWNWNEE